MRGGQPYRRYMDDMEKRKREERKRRILRN
jgi:hypothetical protein